MSKLLQITTSVQSGGDIIDYAIKRSTTPDPKTSLSTYGFTIRMRQSITGNCQLGSIEVAQKLAGLTTSEFLEFMNTIIYNRPSGIASYRKSSFLLDINQTYVSRIEYRFKKAGAFIRLKKKYKNRTTSPMCIMIVDTQGRRPDEQ